MTIISSGKKHITKKMSPNGQVVLAWKPKDYEMTSQQKKVKNFSAECGITKGISKASLLTRMKCCMSNKWGNTPPANCTEADINPKN